MGLANLKSLSAATLFSAGCLTLATAFTFTISADPLPPRVLGEHLLFEDQEHFRDVMTQLAEKQELADHEQAQQDVFGDYAAALEFHSLANEIESRTAALERADGVTDENDPDDHFVPDPYLRNLVSPRSEIVIGDTIHRIEKDRVLSISGLDFQALERIRSGEEVEQGNVRSHSFLKRDLGVDCCVGDVLSVATHLYPGGKRRTKATHWSLNLVFYQSIGARTRHQRMKSNGGWKRDKVEQLKMWGKYREYPCNDSNLRNIDKRKIDAHTVDYVRPFGYGIEDFFDTYHVAEEDGEKRLIFRAESYALGDWQQFDGGDRRLQLKRLCDCPGSEWLASEGAAANWAPLADSCLGINNFAFGDFNGDGVADVFYPDGTTWWFSDGGVGAFQALNASAYILNSLAFGDFNADGITDVFRATGTEWLVSYSGTGPWTQLATSGYGIEDLEFVDFNGDQRTDVMRASGAEWIVSFGGNGPWVVHATSGFTLDKLAFGDFNGDHRTDVFRTTGGQWLVSLSGNGPWVPLATSAASLSRLAFGDFDGDNRTDVFVSSGGQWYISSAGVNNWQSLATSGVRPEVFGFGAFLNSPTTDVFHAGF